MSFTVDKEYIEQQLTDLITVAAFAGFVITIETVPTEPLRMGGFRMVGQVRQARSPG